MTALNGSHAAPVSAQMVQIDPVPLFKLLRNEEGFTGVEFNCTPEVLQAAVKKSWNANAGVHTALGFLALQLLELRQAAEAVVDDWITNERGDAAFARLKELNNKLG